MGWRRPRHATDRKRGSPRRRCAEREARTAFGKDEVYLDELVRQARRMELQILDDNHGDLVHLFERDCSIQRRNRKIIERHDFSALSRDAARHPRAFHQSSSVRYGLIVERVPPS